MPFFKSPLVRSRLAIVGKGFSLIELLIVISLFGVAASLITASYLSFDRNQRLKNAALVLKSDLRLVQNHATSGDKGQKSADTICPRVGYTLGGWYLKAAAGAHSYSFGGVCVRQSDGSETLFYDPVITQKVVNLPSDLIISRVFYDAGNLDRSVAIFFRPLNSGVSYHNADATFPAFFTADGVTLNNLMPGIPQNSTVGIEIGNTAATYYQVCVKSTGEISDLKPGSGNTCTSL